MSDLKRVILHGPTEGSVLCSSGGVLILTPRTLRTSVISALDLILRIFNAEITEVRRETQRRIVQVKPLPFFQNPWII